jgi:predicted dinucleotide-binding enzyme
MKIIIIGCGRTGAGLARTLGLGGHAVTVVDPDPASFERLGPSFKGQSLAGVGFDRDVLVRAGIERADALAAVTASAVPVLTLPGSRQSLASKGGRGSTPAFLGCKPLKRASHGLGELTCCMTRRSAA